jgi:hypothetical protein
MRRIAKFNCRPIRNIRKLNLARRDKPGTRKSRLPVGQPALFERFWVDGERVLRFSNVLAVLSGDYLWASIGCLAFGC